MTLKWIVLLPVALVGCRNASHQDDIRSTSRVSEMDSAMVRRLCAAPDSVLAGRRSCVLLDQRPPRTVF